MAKRKPQTEVDLRAEEEARAKRKETIEKLAATLNYLDVVTILNKYIELNGALEVDNYIAHSLPPDRLAIYKDAYRDRILYDIDEEMFLHYRQNYRVLMRKRNLWKRFFPEYPNLRIVELNFDEIRRKQKQMYELGCARLGKDKYGREKK